MTHQPNWSRLERERQRKDQELYDSQVTDDRDKPPLRNCCSNHWDQDASRVNHLVRQPMYRPFIVCQTCGNKRCPKATDCSLDCTGLNEPGQKGSIYE